MTRKDPPVRADGLCVVCGKPRKMPRSHHRSISRAVYELDAFCSSLCARAYFDNPLPSASIWARDPNERRGKHERKAA